jgi:hypothetical protein
MVIGTYAMKHLFEANNHIQLPRFYNDTNVNVINVLLYDKIQEVDWYQMGGTGDSIFKENTGYYDNCKPYKRTTLDLDTFLLQSILFSILIIYKCQ